MLGVPRDAGQSTIKAAWRRLARENHPDLTQHDPAAAERATRRMAEINRAYNDYTYIPPSKIGQTSSPRVRVNGLLNRALVGGANVEWWWLDLRRPGEC